MSRVPIAALKDARSDVRPSTIAGQWYPGSPNELQETVDEYLAQADYVQTDAELIGLISPHAGFAYSGQTAAHAYRQLENLKFDTVVLLGPSHHGDSNAITVTSKHYYWTPLGTVELDQEFIHALEQKVQVQSVEQDSEHSLEIQLPFLQRTLGNFKLVPLMLSLPFYIVGASAWTVCEQLASALAEIGRDKHVLFVASSDLSHLPNYSAVQKNDARTEALLAAFDIPGLFDYMWRGGECRACGDAPIITMLSASKALGADQTRILHRTNSGDVTGDKTPGKYTVGYMAAAIYKTKH
jgi:MEMO1 family protein